MIWLLMNGFIDSSPHPRGCFVIHIMLQEQVLLFPAPAGVFLFPADAQLMLQSLPRTRGGVSCACGSFSRI